VAATITVVTKTHLYALVAGVIAASVCFLIRMLGVRFSLNAPRPPGAPET